MRETERGRRIQRKTREVSGDVETDGYIQKRKDIRKKKRG